MYYFRLKYISLVVGCLRGALSLQHQHTRRDALDVASSFAAGTLLFPESCPAAEDTREPPKFRRYPQIRFIAALGDPASGEGSGSEQWSQWKDDPGPRGVYLRNYESKLAKTGISPAGWSFDKDDWWLEEHGLIMSNPEPLLRKRFVKETKEILPYKRYVVTGDREVTTVLTVWEDGRWKLQKGSLYDVTHLPCRSARYTPVEKRTGTCTPSMADRKMFPVRPGADMPPVSGCAKQDYAVLFVLGEEI
mmetsp:Transcript_27315/g.42219  ORF Transcript_27315/g.42219 Transcript_27315/m.42219 type:complete len:248 (+) Transcript_27315:47-790(+)